MIKCNLSDFEMLSPNGPNIFHPESRTIIIMSADLKSIQMEVMTGCRNLEHEDHGNLTSDQVIIQEIQFPGMDIGFNVYPHTLPVCSHPVSQQFPLLMLRPSFYQRAPYLFWRNASLRSLSQPSVTDVPDHLPSTPQTRPYKLSKLVKNESKCVYNLSVEAN